MWNFLTEYNDSFESSRRSSAVQVMCVWSGDVGTGSAVSYSGWCRGLSAAVQCHSEERSGQRGGYTGQFP